jgi:hypothetical protein
VSTSRAESTRTVKYGFVWKKLNATDVLTAVTAPAARPPTDAAATTTSTMIKAVFALPNVLRKGTIAAAVATATNANTTPTPTDSP